MTISRRMGTGGRILLAAAALGGCRPDQDAKVPDALSLGPLLDTIPVGLAEETNSPDSKFPLRGRVAECRAKKECMLQLYGGDIIVSLKFLPEYNGHAEIAWVGQQGDWMTFRMKVDFNFRDASDTYQNLAMGEKQRLFNTDLSVTPVRAQNGSLYLKVEH
ncbi:MAG TPA: hypothetical protein VLD37_03275 [Candidatus Bilamarchaeum sp.]|nr:hypothetical protein [Candidatus Bilamarchaeum sp.]